MNASKDPRTTEALLHIARFMRPLAVVQELERRGYWYNPRHGRFIKEPTVMCNHCGGTHQAGQSCDCFDNGCQ